jgi:hypothetical protein
MWIILKDSDLRKKVKDIVAPPFDQEDQRNIYVTEDDESYYPEDIKDVIL